MLTPTVEKTLCSAEYWPTPGRLSERHSGGLASEEQLTNHDRSCSPSRLSASDTTMLERNRLQPPRPSAPSQTAGWFDGPTAGCGGLFASAEDYDATGILAGADPCESRYWWMPELYTSPLAAGAPAVEAEGAGTGGESIAAPRRSGLVERLLRGGQAARRTGSRSPAAA
jgi:hypothetical protein